MDSLWQDVRLASRSHEGASGGVARARRWVRPTADARNRMIGVMEVPCV